MNKTLRDEIAITVMAALIAKVPACEVEGRDGCAQINDDDLTEMQKGIALSAYEQADAMMDAR